MALALEKMVMEMELRRQELKPRLAPRSQGRHRCRYFNQPAEELAMAVSKDWSKPARIRSISLPLMRLMQDAIKKRAADMYMASPD